MSKQDGLLQFNGAIENLSFYKTKRGYVVRKRSGVSGARIAKDPAFRRTLENSMEFGRAGKAGKLFRTAFRDMITDVADSSITPRLLSAFLKVIKADSTSERGLRHVKDAAVKGIEHFECNSGSVMSTSFYAPLTATIDRVAGKGAIVIPPFNPAKKVQAPRGATHFIITGGLSAIDFEGAQYESEEESSEALPLDSYMTAPLILTATVPQDSPFPLFLALRMVFVQMVNGKEYQLSDRSYNSMKVMVVSVAE